MEETRAAKILAEAGAVITDSHFVYTSGLHGSVYINKDAVYPRIHLLDELCRHIAGKFAGGVFIREAGIEVVVAPAIGAIDLKTGVARELIRYTGREVLGVYAEHDEELVVTTAGLSVPTKKPQFVIKRGYGKLVAGKQVLVVEDILTTGGSARETVEAVRQAGGNVVAVAAIVNRGGVTAESLGVSHLSSLLDVNLETHPAAECPLCRDGVPVNVEYGHGRKFLNQKA